MSIGSNSINWVMTREPVSVAQNASLADALDIMRNWGIRHLPVADVETEAIHGLLSERDIYRHLALGNADSDEVSSAMTKNPFLVGGSERISKVVRVMADHKLGSAIVTHTLGRLYGIFTTTDAMAILADLIHEGDNSKFKMMTVEDYVKFYQTQLAV